MNRGISARFRSARSTSWRGQKQGRRLYDLSAAPGPLCWRAVSGPLSSGRGCATRAESSRPEVGADRSSAACLRASILIRLGDPIRRRANRRRACRSARASFQFDAQFVLFGRKIYLSLCSSCRSRRSSCARGQFGGRSVADGRARALGAPSSPRQLAELNQKVSRPAKPERNMTTFGS